jgi:arylsulfatase A-like enzyme
LTIPPDEDLYGNTIDYSSCTNTNQNRRIFCQLMTYFENSLRLVIEKLQELDFYDDTLIFILSDNGGQPGAAMGSSGAFGSNLPLRGRKGTVFEGGIHVPAFITGGKLDEDLRGEVYNGKFYVADWFPTFLNIAGQSDLIPDDIDGVNQWDYIKDLDENGREETVYIVRDSVSNSFVTSYIRQGDYKLIINGSFPNAMGARYIRYDNTINSGIVFDPYRSTMLFNIRDDPYEQNNLADQSEYSSLKVQLYARLNTIFTEGGYPVQAAGAAKGGIAATLDSWDDTLEAGALLPWADTPEYADIHNNPDITVSNLLQDFLAEHSSP